MTIRSRLLLSNLAMVLVPLALVISLNAVLLSFVQEGSAPGPAFRVGWPWFNSGHRPLPTRQMLALSQSTLRKINVETLRHPEALGQRSFWAGLDGALAESDAGLAVRSNGELLYLSPSLGDAATLTNLPAYATLENGWNRREEPGDRVRILAQWDFPALGDQHLTVFLLWVPQAWNAAVETFSSVLMSGFFLSTLGVGLLLTWLMVRSFLRPLRRLQEAATRITDGDLSPNPVPGRRDELGPLFAAFETMRGRLEENRHLRDRFEADRRDLIAHLAHDLKTPVTAINGYVQGILEGIAATPEKQRQYLEVIAAKARDLDRRTDELVFFSGLELGTLPYEFQVFDWGVFLRGLWSEFLVEYGPQGLEGPAPLVPDEPLPIRGDPARLRRLLANLADNTVKFRRGERVVWRWSLEVGPSYRLWLADDGVGIGAEALPHVFERFYREDGSRTSQVPGTGLGLSIVRRIAEDHGGRVEARHNPEGGVTIVLELPRP